MQDAHSGLNLDSLYNDFGENAVFALDLLDQYRRDRRSVDRTWREYLDRVVGASAASIEASETSEDGRSRTAVGLEEPPASTSAPSGADAPAAPRTPVARTATLPGDTPTPIRGGAVRIVENMEASLVIPTATSVRTVPVRTLEENRRILNRHREAAAASKISFTHLIAWAIVRALDKHPRLNDAFATIDGRPHRIQHDSVRLGVAVDVPKKDGSRSLLVPNIKDAGRLDFAAFLKAYDGLVEKARTGAISPDDFVGTTISLTNPGTVGTTQSAPRLMPGQGAIVATGALEYPAEYQSMSPRTLSLLGISKVMTITSTYDHRIIQGAESGVFLATIERLLKGDNRFYEEIFEDLGIPHQPVKWEVDITPGLFGEAGNLEQIEKEARVLQLINAYRVRGHLVADVDPLDSTRAPHLDLDPATYGLTLWDLDREFITNGLSGKDRATLREILDVLRNTYCGTMGAEYMFIADPDRKAWLMERMESATHAVTSIDVKRRILEKLVEAESFERFLHAKYVGHKRFSLEGNESLIPLLDRLLNDATRGGVEEAVIGMPHRGRLNVLANTIGKPLAQIFSEFEGNVDPQSIQGSGDVKYHLGARGVHVSPTGERLTVSVAPNPSHLEFVNPVVEGMVRARQDQLGDRARSRVLPILLHGDAAFAGQGIVAETLNLAGLDGYTTGGTIHVVVNNQIGFTTLPHDARTSTYCTDVAKMVQAPVFHVNGDDPEAVDRAAALAYEYRQHFKQDVVIDIVGYRRWGHNEGDEPSYTQPLMYARIKAQTSAAQLYAVHLTRSGAISKQDVDALWAAKKAEMQRVEEGPSSQFASVSKREPQPLPEVGATELRARLRRVLQALGSVPAGIDIHPKLLPHVRKRAELFDVGGDLDWATGEALAFGSLLLEGIPVRLSGQDSGRGTFSQRHAVLYDIKTQKEYVPLNALAEPPARFEVHDSLLSEAAVMGFEFGYAVTEARALVMWEAQFGDFANGAQVIIDQFLAASGTKWGQPSSLTLLLPHGMEGQGPEHSSARLERFLDLCADDNMRVVYPSSPAQYFHALRWQGRDPIQKPLVVMTPKSLLRHPRCVSTLDELAEGRFQQVIGDESVAPSAVRRVLIMTGKIYYDMLKARDDRDVKDIALVRVEQLYPFPGAALANVLSAYPADAELVWVQEEPWNMGAWRYARERFLDNGVPGFSDRPLRYVGRRASASPATGSHKTHIKEHDQIIESSFQ